VSSTSKEPSGFGAVVHHPPARVTIKDVARAADVSTGTVSNVFNYPERVSADKLLRVQQALSDLKFVRNEFARHLRTGSSQTLGLMLLDAWNPFFTELARGVEDSAFSRGWKVLISNTARETERETAYLGLFVERRVDGLIIVPNGDLSDRLRDLRHQGVATVIADQRDDRVGSMSVSVDDVLGGELAFAHLLELGHRRLAFAGNPLEAVQVGDRLLGARRAIAQARARASLRILDGKLSLQGGFDVGESLMSLPAAHRPTAVFASSDLVAIGLLNVLLRNKVRVPEDIAIVGYDDIEFARQAAVPLTSVRQPAYRMGQTAADMIIGELRGDPPKQRHVVFAPELIVRNSSARVIPG
jgi:LacI family transcriptional regulator